MPPRFIKNNHAPARGPRNDIIRSHPGLRGPFLLECTCVFLLFLIYDAAATAEILDNPGLHGCINAQPFLYSNPSMILGRRIKEHNSSILQVTFFRIPAVAWLYKQTFQKQNRYIDQAVRCIKSSRTLHSVFKKNNRT